MGYVIRQVESIFTIKRENINSAWEALKQTFNNKKDMIHDASGFHYSFVDTDKVLNAESFEEAMKAIRWEVHSNMITGDITSINFIGEKMGDDMCFFYAIAPYVEDNSYIFLRGEDNCFWNLHFKGNKIYVRM